jgi:hypothetical protein
MRLWKVPIYRKIPLGLSDQSEPAAADIGRRETEQDQLVGSRNGVEWFLLRESETRGQNRCGWRVGHPERRETALDS